MGAQYSYGLMVNVGAKSTTSVTGLPDVEGPSSTGINLGLNDGFSINVNLHF
jgi:hypothetical protein